MLAGTPLAVKPARWVLNSVSCLYSFFQVRQRQIFKQQVEIFVFGDLENEIILTFTVLAGVALTAAAATAALWPFDAIVLYEMIVTGVDAMARAAAPLMKHRFVDIGVGNRYGFATVYVGDRTLVDGLGDRLFNLRLVAAQKRWRFTMLLFLPFSRRSMK